MTTHPFTFTRVTRAPGAVGLLAAVLMLACTPAAPPLTPATINTPGGHTPGAPVRVKLGLLLPLSGPDAASGKDALAGAEVAVEQFEEATSDRVELMVRDNRSLPSSTATGVKELTEEGALLIVGDLDTARTHVARDQADVSNITLISPTAMPAADRRDREWTIYTLPDARQLGEALADLIEPTSRIGAVYYPGSDDSKSAVDGAKNGVDLRGGKLEHFAPIAPGGETALDGPAERLKGDGVQTIVLAVSPGDAALMVTALGAPRLVLIGTDSWATAELGAHAATLERARYAAHFAPDAPWDATRGFVARYRKRYAGATPGATAACAFDAVMIGLEAAHRARATSRVAVLHELRKVTERAGATGKLSLGAVGEVRAELPVLKIVDGRPMYDGVVKTRQSR